MFFSRLEKFFILLAAEKLMFFLFLPIICWDFFIFSLSLRNLSFLRCCISSKSLDKASLFESSSDKFEEDSSSVFTEIEKLSSRERLFSSSFFNRLRKEDGFSEFLF